MIIRQAYRHLNKERLFHSKLTSAFANTFKVGYTFNTQFLKPQGQCQFATESSKKQLNKILNVSEFEEHENKKKVVTRQDEYEAQEELDTNYLQQMNMQKPKHDPNQIKESKKIKKAMKKEAGEGQNKYEFIKAEEANNRHDRNYQRLIFDTYDCVKFLNRLPLGVLEESCDAFRKNLFSMSGRKQIPNLIYSILEKELKNEEAAAAGLDPDTHIDTLPTLSGMNEVRDKGLFEVSKEIYHSLQVVLEFMDKGVKGLLSGDVSVYIIQQIQASIEKLKHKFEDISAKIENLLEKKETLDIYFNKNFSIGSEQVYNQNQKGYAQSENFEAFSMLIRRDDWKKHFGDVTKTQYLTSSEKLISSDMITSSKHPNTQVVHFDDHKNMEEYMKTRVQSIQDENVEKIEGLKKDINFIINKLYDEVTQTALNLDKYRIPIHGITFPALENPMNLFQRQLKIEELSFELSHAKYKNTLDSLIKLGKAEQLAVSHRYILNWMKGLDSAINEQQKIFLKRGNLDPQKSKIGYYLIQMPSEKIATLCVLHLMKHLFKQFVNDIRKYADEEAQLSDKQVEGTSQQDVKITAIQLFDELGKLFDKELKASISQSKHQGKHDQPFQKQQMSNNIQQHLLVDDHQIGALPRDAQLKIGAFLTNLMCKNLRYKIGNKSYLLLKPQVLKESKQRYLGYVIFNKSFIENFIGELDKIHDLNLQLERSLPMVYPPAPWKNYNFGGYYLKQTKMAKVIPNFKEAIRYLNRVDLSNMCHVLDVLGSVKWRLNRKILEMIEYVWSIGGGLGEVPKKFNERVITPEMIKQAKFREKLKLLKEHQHNKETHSLRCEFLLRLSISQSFKTADAIYFPHNMDFRGRVYPIPPHLNHMGPDINRGMLEFSEGKKLGKEGLWWLKLHLANKIGKDKLPLPERVAYAESIMDTVHKCAQDPKNNLEWLQSDNPWQTLTAMFELSEAMKLPNPEEYISHAHIHVDGSCNGMQHYAALGKDNQGARQVNLADSERPGDVYTAILKLVIKDIENEKDPVLLEVAEGLKGNVTRKVIKQTVMTSVYGVTFIGARAQIMKQLKEKRLYETNGELYKASQYLAKLTIKCIGDLFRDANNIKEWFAKCAKVVASTGEPVKWMSPLGLPCVQPYKYMSQKNMVSTILQNITIVESLDEQPVNKSKQNTAFPPNFVHSLDSSHMMFTALQCFEEKITFAAVHDSYWCHATNVPRMNIILREQFVNLHDASVIEDLNENFLSRYPHEKFPQIPKRGEFDLNEVKKSTYFFS